MNPYRYLYSHSYSYNENERREANKSFLKLIEDEEWRQKIIDTVDEDSLGRLAYNVMNAYGKSESGSDRVHPMKERVFKAINMVPIKDVKAVIVGREPFQGKADGLAFSTPLTPDGVRDFPINESFKVMAQKLREEGYSITDQHGDLTQWAERGVLLLNSILTVRQGTPRSHEGWGWEKVTDAIIKIVNDNCQEKQRNVVFLLCGGEAHKKALQIKSEYAKVYYAYHPAAVRWQNYEMKKRPLLEKLRTMRDEESSLNECVTLVARDWKYPIIKRTNANKVFYIDGSYTSKRGYPKTPLHCTTFDLKDNQLEPWKVNEFHGAEYLKHAKDKLDIAVDFDLSPKEDILSGPLSVIQKKEEIYFLLYLMD